MEVWKRLVQDGSFCLHVLDEVFGTDIAKAARDMNIHGRFHQNNYHCFPVIFCICTKSKHNEKYGEKVERDEKVENCEKVKHGEKVEHDEKVT